MQHIHTFDFENFSFAVYYHAVFRLLFGTFYVLSLQLSSRLIASNSILVIRSPYNCIVSDVVQMHLIFVLRNVLHVMHTHIERVQWMSLCMHNSYICRLILNSRIFLLSLGNIPLFWLNFYEFYTMYKLK